MDVTIYSSDPRMHCLPAPAPASDKARTDGDDWADDGGYGSDADPAPVPAEEPSA